MIQHYLEAVVQGLQSLWGMATQLTFILVFVLLIGAIVFAVLHQQNNDLPITDWLKQLSWRRIATEAAAYAGVVIVLALGWAVLRTARPVAMIDMRWRDSAQVTTNPAPDAPPVAQYGPAVARLSERPYTRSLTLPPEFLSTIHREGVGALAPYLTDPSAQNVINMRDVFRRKGRSVVFTRRALLLDEKPVSFSSSRINVNFQRLPGRAYDVVFDAHYTFKNPDTKSGTFHFLYTLPQAGAIRDLNITMDKQAIPQPTNPAGGESNTYEWKSAMQPGERHEAVVHYRVVGTRMWSYDLGSQRRRVEEFQLQATGAGPVRFLRKSLQPTGNSNGTLSWEMSNVVTAQQIALSFATDALVKRLYLQALSALPASLLLFVVGFVASAVWFRQMPTSTRLLGGMVLFIFGLCSAIVLTIHFGQIVGLIVGPVIGACLAAAAMGRCALLAGLPAALIPATFLSAQNTGLMIVVIALLTLIATFAMARISSRSTRRALAAI